MKITIVQTIIVLEDDEQPQRQPPVHPILDLIQRMRYEMQHGRSECKKLEGIKDGPYVPQ